ncbi:MAG: diaminopimelate decarboxylase [Pelagibacteraceae bacterium]|nr:diaminopimelate decarboxylase [Pelagibacteraceae bacterium]|tara:strand:- start:14987 stop:16231 length:1245 start_codon:yes stop_codon:yes gene_type:complete
MIKYENNKPFIEGVNLEDIIKTQNTPFYIYSQNKITESYNSLKKALGNNIFFSVKANSNLAIIKLMKNLGAGADVVSVGELKKAIHAGIHPNKIIFEGVGKSKEDLLLAVKQNIRIINVESIEELNSINSIAKSINVTVNIGVRLNPNIDGKTLDKISTGKKTNKFGIAIESVDTIKTNLQNYKNLKLVAISCHIGSQIFDINIFKKVFNTMKKAAENFTESGFKISHVDLGGGFGVQYKPDDPIVDLKLISEVINEIFNKSKYEISFEPGRYLIANAGILVTKILTKKNNGGINYLITDAGMHTLIRPALYNTTHVIEPLNNKSKKNELYTVAGPICESSDILAHNIILPEQDINNVLIIKDTGAYGSVMASNYNSRGLPAEILVNRNSFSVIYKPKTIDEYIADNNIPSWLN